MILQISFLVLSFYLRNFTTTINFFKRIVCNICWINLVIAALIVANENMQIIKIVNVVVYRIVYTAVYIHLLFYWVCSVRSVSSYRPANAFTLITEMRLLAKFYLSISVAGSLVCPDTRLRWPFNVKSICSLAFLIQWLEFLDSEML